MDLDLIHYRELDARLVSLVKDIKMLSTLSWPKRAQEEFLAAWRVKLCCRQDDVDTFRLGQMGGVGQQRVNLLGEAYARAFL